ncbi:MAG: sigma-54-dependent Fis family transcriptional regulator [Deltaproteobacteria bacterium]|nr:sigma-54-dependent Fis family transcriptional regulator [Deltaproteobacteria bacterium]
MSHARILVVDDEQSIRELLEIMLKREKYDVVTAENGKKALKKLEKESFDIVITDIQMPELSGIELLEKTKNMNEDIVVMMITAYGSTESAVHAMKLGAYDYITKPFKVDELKIIVRKALDSRNLKRENIQLKKALESKYSFQNIVGSAPVMVKLYDMIERVSQTKSNILITGESGTGKELIAKAIHYNGPLKDKPFVTINCGAIPENLMESEMFGHKKGSFTGAIVEKTGLFEIAHKGTIFLDEVGDLPLSIQVKLLRAIQERTFRKVGGTQDISVDVRVICATNKDLEKEVKEGRFREDLYYRLNVIHLNSSPLRERKEDIPTLTLHFLEKYNKEFGKDVKKISQEAMEALKNYHFPGNVRELENIIERTVALTDNLAILPEHLPPQVFNLPSGNSLTSLGALKIGDEPIDLEGIVGRIEKDLLVRALAKTGGVKKKAAKLLGISFRSMRYRLEKHNME